MLNKDLLALMPDRIELNTVELPDTEQNILLDDVLAREVARIERVPTVRVWRHTSQPGLVVSRRDVAGERGAAAMQTMAALGCPIIVRPTGGTAVPHGAGVLNFSLLLPRRQQQVSTEAYYQLLCQPLLDWLASLGLAAATGALPGSYCDGNYNILVDGKKLVGTAQAWRGGLAGVTARHPGYVLAHACIVIDCDMDWVTTAINRFYAEIGDTYRVDGSKSTTLIERQRLRGDVVVQDGWMAQQSLVRFLNDYYRSQGLQVQLP